MKFGVSIFPTDYSIQPAELARAVEERGFESLFVTEHTHIPVSRVSPSYIPGELPKHYWHTHDAFVALTVAAAVTATLRLGTGVCLVTEHSPIGLAKRAASLDFVSGGRFIFGVGAGWNAEEMADHGVAFGDRWKVTRERVEAMKTIWREEEPEFHGEFVNFEKLWSWPKPIQAGGPPVLIGANSKWTFERIADYADGWYAIDGVPGFATPEEGKELLRIAAEKRGRAFSEFDLSVASYPAEARVTQLIELGVNRVVFGLPSEPAEAVMPLLDGLEKVARQFP